MSDINYQRVVQAHIIGTRYSAQTSVFDSYAHAKRRHQTEAIEATYVPIVLMAASSFLDHA